MEEEHSFRAEKKLSLKILLKSRKKMYVRERRMGRNRKRTAHVLPPLVSIAQNKSKMQHACVYSLCPECKVFPHS